MTNSTIHTTVMRRVRTIHTLQSAASGVGAAVLLLLLSLYLIGREVWVARVWENMPNIAHVRAFTQFFTYAFTHTHFSVQILILLSVFALLWLLREIARFFLLNLPRTQRYA